ncbi:FkbM family methyltransferase [Agrobacterium tumefaciens]|uniref:FkbM family methyltransferase n=1 Tax=Agrobacterium tumefaciens TaxID=358 RepID=UPI003BA365FF
MRVFKQIHAWFDRSRHILGVSRAVEHKADALLRRRASNYFYTGGQTALYVRSNGVKLQLDLRDAGILNFLATDSYEPDVSSVINQHLSEGDTYIDVGANLGIHTVAAARKVGNTGRVIAIEANPFLHKFLKRNVALNGAASITKVVNGAAWSSEGTIEFSFEEDQHRVGAVVLESATNYGDTKHAVDAVMIDNLVPQGRPVKLIKIDIEGREPFAIEGAWQTIQNNNCIVVSEYHREVIESTYGATKFDQLITTLGLKPHSIERDGRLTALSDWPKEHANIALTKGSQL